MKRFLLFTLSVLILLIVAVLVGPSFVDWSAYKPKIREQVKTYTGLDIDLGGDLGLRVFPNPTFYVEKVSVSAGENTKIAAIKRLDISLSLLPLLSGKVEVHAVNLVSPEITLDLLADGRPRWSTPQLDKFFAVKDVAAPKFDQASAILSSISLQGLSIEKGAIAYKKAPAVAFIRVQDINLSLSAETLQGPFDVQGDFMLSDTKMDFSAKTGVFDTRRKSSSLTAQLSIPAHDFKGQFAGVVSNLQGFEVQGETEVELTALPGFAEPVQVKGLVSADDKSLEYKEMSVDFADQSLQGPVVITYSPLSVQGTINAKAPVNLDVLLPRSASTSQAGFNFQNPGSFLPKVMPLPKDLQLNVKLSAPSVTHNNVQYQNIQAQLRKKDNRVMLDPFSANLPGQGELKGSIGIEPERMTIALNLKAQDFPVLSKAFSEQKMSLAKTVSVDFDGALTPQALQVQKSKILLDETSYEVSGELNKGALNVLVLAYSGTLNLKGDVSASGIDAISVRGKHGNLSSLIGAISGQNKSYPELAKPVSFSANIEQGNKEYGAENFNIQLGDIKGEGAFSVNLAAEVPSLQADLSFNEIVFAKSKQIMNAQASAGAKLKAPPAKNSPRWSTDEIDTTWFGFLNADIKIKAKSLQTADWRFESPVIAAKLQDRVLNITQMQAGLYGGQANLTASVDVTKDLKLGTLLEFKDADIEQLTRSFVGTELIKGSGRISVHADVSAQGQTQEALVSSLSGPVSLNGKSLVLDGFDLTRFGRALSEDTKPGDTLLGLWKGSVKGGSTMFDTMDGKIQFVNGVGTIEKLNLNGPKALLGTTGSVDLPKWWLSTDHTITLKEREDVPPFTMEIDGPLDNPAQTFAEGALKDYLARKINRKLEKLLTDKLGTALGRKPSPSVPTDGSAPANDNQVPASPEEALKGLLEGLIQ